MKALRLATLGLVCLCLLALREYAPKADTLPLTTKVYDRTGAQVGGVASVGVRVKDQSGNGINGVPVTIEMCDAEITLPCSKWVGAVSGTTAQIGGRWIPSPEDGWILGSTLDNQLMRITCGTSVQTQFIAQGITQIVIGCTQTPTAVLISSFIATAGNISTDIPFIALVAFGLGALFVAVVTGVIKWAKI